MPINLKDIYLITRSRRFHNRSDIVAKRNCLDRVLQFGREGMSENSFIIRDIHRIRGENLEPPQFACIGTGNVLRDLFETVRSEWNCAQVDLEFVIFRKGTAESRSDLWNNAEE